MRTVFLAGMTLAMAGAAWGQTPQQPSEMLLGVVGHCWQAELEAAVTDTHCFTVSAGGKLVMDVHKVRSLSGRVVYEGVTLYRLDMASGAIRYDYFNSNGDLLPGYGKRDGDRLLFSETPGGASTAVWYLGPDAYEVGTNDATAAKRKFVKTGPASAGGL